jgi:hypothetical protein
MSISALTFSYGIAIYRYTPWGGGEGSCREEGPGKEVGGRKEEREAG